MAPAHFHPTPDQVAWIYDQPGKEVQITLSPPLVGHVEEAPQKDLLGDAPQGVLVVSIRIVDNNNQLCSASVKFSDNTMEIVGEWAYRPSLDEIASAIFEEINKTVEFTPACREAYEETADA